MGCDLFTTKAKTTNDAVITESITTICLFMKSGVKPLPLLLRYQHACL